MPKLPREALYMSPYRREVITISEVVVGKLRIEIAGLADSSV